MPKPDPGAESKPAPDFQFRPLGEEKPFSLSSLKGKVVVLEFWATWCSDCVRGMPKQRELNEAFVGKDVVFLGVAHPKGGAEAVTQAVKRYGLHARQMLDEPVDGKRIADLYQVEWIPSFLFIDKQGRLRGIQKSIEGMKYLDAKVVIQRLLEE